MDIKQPLVIISFISVILAFTTVSFRKALYTCILLSGVLGIPVIIVRQSHFMFSELFLVPLLFLWLVKKKFGIGFIRLSELSKIKTNIEKSMWVMIGAFAMGSIFNILFKNPSVGGEHIFFMGKVLALFLYVAPVLAALMIADFIGSFDDVRSICLVLIILGIFAFIVQSLKNDSLLSLLKYFQGDVGWSWLNVTILFSFSLAYFVFHPQVSKKLQNIFIVLILSIQIVSSFFSGTASYKALILANYFIVVTILYYRSRIVAFMFSSLTIIIIVSVGIVGYYSNQEIQEGSWGDRYGARKAVWYHSFLIFKERPIFGVGPYNYYDYSLYMAKKRRMHDERWGVMTSPHGQYIQILVETGVIGSLAFLWFMVELFKLLKYFLKHNFDYKTKIVASAIAAILVSRLAIGILGDYVIPQYHNGGLQNFSSTVFFWICLGVLMGLKKIIMIETTQTE